MSSGQDEQAVPKIASAVLSRYLQEGRAKHRRPRSSRLGLGRGPAWAPKQRAITNVVCEGARKVDKSRKGLDR